MYLDYILLAAGGVCLLIFLVLLIVLLRFRGQRRDYHRILREETQRLDVMNTLSQTIPHRTKTLLNSPSGTAGKTAETRQTAATEAIAQTEATELLSPEEAEHASAAGDGVGAGLDLSPLEGTYTLLEEIYGGGMSRVFLARHNKLGSKWIVKFVDSRHAGLANEAEVLKKLNHISLPPIIDIFQSPQGTFLVERYIEGFTLEEVLQSGQTLPEGQISDWGAQLAHVLRYLHSLDTPIIHCDLKPSNIMVTHDDRLVLIDFGISKGQGDADPAGITYRYAAPEQFRAQASRTAAAQRFGALPPDAASWPIDARTDLYSAGVILYELVMGRIPAAGQVEDVRQHATPKLADVICKCLEIRPERRFQSAGELIQALDEVKGQRLTIARELTLSRVAAVCCAVFLLGGLITSASGAYVYQRETLSVIDLDPGEAVVTAQQSIQVVIRKTIPGGEPVFLDPGLIRWTFGQKNVARMDGDRLVGLNPGETTMYGQYRNKEVVLHVTVAEPVGELTQIALRYAPDQRVSVYAGSGERETEDGLLSSCSFVSPEGMAWSDGRLYVSDAGVIRTLQDGQTASIFLEPEFLTADLVRGWGGDLYVLTGPWEDENGSYYGFVRIGDSGAEFLYYTEAAWSTITDFAFDSQGTLWFVQQNLGAGSTTLNALDPVSLECDWVADLPEGARAMAFDETDTLYLSVPELGVILRLGKGDASWTYFAGVEGERDMIDGQVPRFYRPTSLAAGGGVLRVLDFDTVREITVEGMGVLSCRTLAGLPTADTSPQVLLGPGERTVLPVSERAALALDGQGRLLLSDPKNSVIYQIGPAE